MRVLQIIKTDEGAQWAFNQAKKLVEMGIEIVCMMPVDKGNMDEKYKKYGMKVINFDASLSFKNPAVFFKKKAEFRNLVEDCKPDIIHVHFVTNILFVRLALKNIDIPRIFQVPGPLHLEKKIYRKLDIYTSKENLDYWIPTCKYSYNKYIEENVNLNHVRLIYYGGYGGNSIYKYEECSNKLHEELKIDDEKRIVGMVSYFYKPSILKGQKTGIKGHEDFFSAMEIVTKHYKNVKVVVIGGPWNGCTQYEKYLKKLAKQKLGDNVFFTGFRTDLKNIYRELDIVVHPSHSENLGGAAESLAAGVPTISTNVGGFPDIVIDGLTGYTVEKQSPEQLANAIERMLKDYPHAKEMANHGRKYIEDLLDIEKTSKEVYDFYQYIMENK